MQKGTSTERKPYSLRNVNATLKRELSKLLEEGQIVDSSFEYPIHTP